MKLVEKFDVYVPILRRKLQNVRDEWVEHELLKSQFDRISDLAVARSRSALAFVGGAVAAPSASMPGTKHIR